MDIRTFLPIILTGLAALLSACSGGEDAEDAATLPAANGTTTTLNQQQKELAGIKTARLGYRLISPAVSFTGQIEVPPQGMASVSAPMGGFIEENRLMPGSYVKKGQVLARLSSPDYISLQQSYLETKSELNFAAQEQERQQLLGEQNATATKKLQQSEASYQTLKGRLAGLKARLQLLGISLQELEKGNIQANVALRAPISGNIMRINHHLGQYAESREVIFEIVNGEDLHVDLQVFEQDIARIAKGQRLLVRPAGSSKTFAATISLVSPMRNPDERTYDVHAHFQEQEQDLRPGMFVTGEILLSQDSVAALPEQAFVQNGGEAFVLVEQNGGYALLPVQTGAKKDGWVHILNAEQLADQQVVVEGAGRLFAAMQRAQ